MTAASSRTLSKRLMDFFPGGPFGGHLLDANKIAANLKSTAVSNCLFAGTA